jgi:hypothetical protein
MFRELSRLRDAERLLKEGRAVEALEIARDPALADHRRAVEARAAARDRLRDDARQAMRDGKLGAAAQLLEVLRRDGVDDDVTALESAFRAARREMHADAAARESAMKEARRLARTGERARALELLQPYAAGDAAELRAEIEAAERREAAWSERVDAAVRDGDSAAVERAFDADEAAVAQVETVRRLFARAFEEALKKRDVDLAARIHLRLKERGLTPVEARDDLARQAVEAGRRRLADADLAGAAAVLGARPRTRRPSSCGAAKPRGRAL